MWFIVLGVLLILLKLGDVGPVGAWSWWGVLAPFGGALLWWAYADASGWTKRREMDKLEQRKVERRRKAMDALGIDRQRQKGEEVAMRVRREAANRIEGERTARREQNEQVVRDSVFDGESLSAFKDTPDEKAKAESKR